MEKFPSYPPPEAENKEPLFVRAHEKAETVLEIDKLSFEDFENSEIYASGIEADKKEVERLEGLFEENRQRQGPENYDKAKKLGTILEGLIHEQAELSEWFGEDCQMINTNEFDDYKNGIDSVAAFGSAASGSFVGANFDVTFTNNPQNKLDRIADDIREKRLGTVKYFAYENFKGELNNVAKAVLMVDIDSLKELSELWVDGKKRTLVVGCR